MKKQTHYTQSKGNKCVQPKINHTYICKFVNSKPLPDTEQQWIEGRTLGRGGGGGEERRSGEKGGRNGGSGERGKERGEEWRARGERET